MNDSNSNATVKQLVGAIVGAIVGALIGVFGTYNSFSNALVELKHAHISRLELTASIDNLYKRIAEERRAELEVLRRDHIEPMKASITQVATLAAETKGEQAIRRPRVETIGQLEKDVAKLAGQVADVIRLQATIDQLNKQVQRMEFQIRQQKGMKFEPPWTPEEQWWVCEPCTEDAPQAIAAEGQLTEASAPARGE